MKELIINFTPTGMIPTKEMTPHVPVSTSEIIEDVHQASEIGITMVHLHARELDTGIPTYKRELYGEIIEGIRKYAPQLVICVSLSGRNFAEFEKRSDPLLLEGALKPDMGSLTLSSLNFNSTASMNAPSMVQNLAKGIVPELEAFDLGMINYAKYLKNKGLIHPPFYFNLLLGNIASSQSDLMHTGLMVRELPDESIWSLAGIGINQLQMNTTAIANGGGVRVGLEDNLWYDADKTILATNLKLIERVHVLAETFGRTIMKPKTFREKMNMEPGNGVYGRKVAAICHFRKNRQKNHIKSHGFGIFFETVYFFTDWSIE